MQKNLQNAIHHVRWAFVPLLLLLTQQVQSQCTNGSAFGTINAPTTNATTTITTCAFGGEYSTINNCTAGSTYLFNATGGTGNYITIHQGTPGGAVLGFGFAPISVVCTAAGPLYLHYNTNAACGTDGSCHTGTIQCTSCPGAPDPCTNITTASCATSYTATLSGAGLWSPASCGFSTPGSEKVYSFTPTVTGVHTLQVTSTNSGGYIDYFYKAASGGCSSTGWTCILDIFSPTTATIGTLTAGTTYYFLLDPETTSSVTQTFQINCPAAPDPCASITTLTCANPVTGSTTGAGVWSPASCGFSTPGTEKVYSFTPTTTGNHTLVVTATNSLYVDYFFKAAAGGCSATGWTCIGDANSPESNTFGPLTAGTTYYILYDPESAGTATQTFRVDCPPPQSAPPCLVSPSSPTNGQTNICPSPTQTLSWPASAGATSYDVYFGTSATPPFIGTTASTSFVVNTPTASQYFWQIRPVNSGGTASGCNIWNFSKIDTQAPTITCPANTTVNNSPATACSAVVTFGAITATDNCSAPTITLLSGLVSGSTFTVGITTNTWRATDAAGNTKTCTHTIQVKDVTLPTITCPANIIKGNAPGFCGANVSYSTPLANDNCGIQAVAFVSGLMSGAYNPVGTTTNVWKATDINTNTSTCSFTVKVNDTEPPTIICPPDLVKGNDVGQCSANLGIYIGTTTIHDNCGVSSSSNNNPGTFLLGTTVVTWVISDQAGNKASCNQNVTIEDREWPTVTCPANINIKTDEGDCLGTVNYAALATDNCPGVIVEYSIPPPASFEIGYTNVEVTATDAQGHLSSCYFQIIVNTRKELCNGLDDDCDGWVDEAEDWSALAKRLASDGAAANEYGVSVDIDGDYAIVGSKENNGSAYILFRDQNGENNWGEAMKLPTPGLNSGSNFGASVSISGGLAAVGAPLFDDLLNNQGVVYLYAQNAGNPAQWDFVKLLFSTDSNADDNFGTSLALNGDRLIVGAPKNDESAFNAGAAYVYYRNMGGTDNWGQQAKLLATTAANDDNMGVSVDLDGDYAIVGANQVDGLFQNVGAAYIFGRNQFGADAWGQVAKLRPGQAKGSDNFGASVGISGAWAIVGADQSDRKATDDGAAFLFYKNQNGISNSWGQSQALFNYNAQAGDHFGSAVAIDEPYAVVAAKGDDPFGAGSGRGFVFLQDGNVWIQVDELADGGGQTGDALGSSAAISGRNIVLGAPKDNNGQKADQGSVTIYGGLCDTEFRPNDSREDLQVNATEPFMHCFPVPFSDVLNIEIKGIQASDAHLVILNAMGQIVADLFKGSIEGDNIFHWQSENTADGLYFLRMTTGEKVLTKPILRVR